MSHLSIRRRLALEAWRIIKHKQAESHQLRQLFWECTQRCNLSCLHCGSDCKHHAQTPDMPKEDFLRAIDSITPHVDPNKVLVIISGGEPLMRDDLEEVGIELYRRGYPWSMVTNGLALTESRLESLRRAGLHAITISLDGLRNEHNWMRGNSHSYDRAVEAIRVVAKATDLKKDVVTCVNRRNIAQLTEIRDLLIGLDMKHWRLFTIFPMGRAAGQQDFQLSGSEFRMLLDFIKDTRTEGKIHASYGCEGFLGEYEGDVRDQFFTCHAGVSVGSIRIDGAISGCLSIRSNYDQGNIYKDDFMEVWRDRFQAYRDRRWMRKDQCADCKMWRYCEGNGMHLYSDDGHLTVCKSSALFGAVESSLHKW